MQLIDPPNGTFTAQQLARLAIYRAAVAAGFYSDWDDTPRETNSEEEASQWLPPTDAPADGETYPFNEAERTHLEQCRATFTAGGYADDLPPAPPAPAATATGEDS